uniref:Gag protein n=1 Tax=Panagrolaimus superbus TaxID=310955 RepID=A0A914ZBB0_9BILA
MSHTFNRLKRELDLILDRLSKNSQAANGRTAPTDANDYPLFVTSLEGDVMLLEECLREIKASTDRLDQINDQATDPSLIAKYECYACGTTSSDGYLKKISEGKNVLSNIRVNIASYTKVINASKPAPIAQATPSPTVTQSYDHLMIPKIKNERFAGDKEGYEFFWNRFKPIHTSTSIDEVDKLYILVGLLDGPAKELLSQYSFVTGNYDLAVKTLKDKYGNKNDVICILLDKFDDLKRQSDSVEDCRKCFDQAEVILNQLERMGQDITQRSFQRRWEKYMIAPWLYDLCLMKLSENDPFKLFREEANEVLKRKERVGERTNESSTTFCNVTSAKESGSKKKQTEKKKYDRGKRKDPQCMFCKEGHWSSDCKSTVHLLI